MAHAGVVIIHDGGQMIGESAVPSPDHEVADVLCKVLFISTLKPINERDRCVSSL
jgi:hypothetical protein